MFTKFDQINYNALTMAGVSVVGILAGIMCSSAISGADNPIALFALLLGFVFMAIGVVAPRLTLHWLVPITFSLDFLKRLLIIFTTITWDNVAWVLALAPLASGGILLGCITRRIFIRRRSEPIERLLFWAGCLLAVIGSIGAIKETDIVAALKVIANNSIYYFLPWAVFQCFRTREEIERFLKLAVIVAIPVAVYGIWQFIFGLQDFEYAYIRSGFALNMAYTIDDVQPRPFSTMSSPHAYSIMMSFMLVCAFFLTFRREGFSKSWVGALLVILAALATSMARGAFLTGLGMIAFSVLFASRGGTRVAYAMSAIFLTALLANAETLLDGLEFWQKYLPSDKAWQEQAFRISTISNRLMGYKNVLLKPSAWPLVANPLTYVSADDSSEELHSHDAYSQMILRFGIIPVAIGIGIAVYFIAKIHAAVLRLPAGSARNLGASMLAIEIAFFISMMGGSGLSVFPLNFWMCLFSGFTIVVCLRSEMRMPSTAIEQGDASAPIPSPTRPRWAAPLMR